MSNYKPTAEQRAKYNENRRKKLAAMSPEEREARLAARREYEREKRQLSGEERRKHDREVRLAYVHNKKLENPNWENDRYMRSKLKKAQRAAELAKTLKEDEQICSRCKFARKKDDFPITRSGIRSTMCTKCYNTVYQGFDTDSLKYWKTQAAAQNTKAKSRLRKYGRLDEQGAFIAVTGEELQALWEKQEHRCAYCGIPLNVLITAYDHKLPLSRGGAHCIDNLQLLCHNCNVSKFTMTDDEYQSFLR